MYKRVIFICAALAMAVLGQLLPVSATCYPVSVDIVSLGRSAAQHYGEKNLTRRIKHKKAVLAAAGRQIARVFRDGFSCAPFPNILGADEWRCTGEARVCTAD